MTAQEARLRLSACRWASEDRSDPYFAEALDKAATEPALAQWWSEQRALDELLASKLNEVAIPAALREGFAK